MNILNPVLQNINLPVFQKHRINRKFNSLTSVTCLWSAKEQNADRTTSCSASASICAELILIADVGNIKKKSSLPSESQTYPVTSQMPHNPVSQSFIPKIPYFASLLMWEVSEMLKGISDFRKFCWCLSWLPMICHI